MSKVEVIDALSRTSGSNYERVEQLYLSQAYLNRTNSDKVHKIRRKVSLHWDIPIRDVAICGSTLFGHSLYKGSDFNKSQSDLDLAIISPKIFVSIMEEVRTNTKNYKDKNRFNEPSHFDILLKYISQKGLINPFYLPRSKFKSAWTDF